MNRFSLAFICFILFLLSACSPRGETPESDSQPVISNITQPSSAASEEKTPEAEFLFNGNGIKKITVTTAADWCTVGFSDARLFEDNGKVYVALKLDFAFSDDAPVVIMGDYCNKWTDETNNWTFMPEEHDFCDEVVALEKPGITRNEYKWSYSMPLGYGAVYTEWVAGIVKNASCKKASVDFGCYPPGIFYADILESFCEIEIEFEE